MELFFAVPGIGAVLHTANPRLSDDQIAYTIVHAGSRALFYDPNMAEIVDRLRPKLVDVQSFVCLESNKTRNVPCYEPMLVAASSQLEWPGFDENEAAFHCYTSGTTGDPQGALSSPRSVVLKAITAVLIRGLGFCA